MRQILQDLRGGRTIVADVPAPGCRPGHLRIATSLSLVSAGTERMLVDFARSSLAGKARRQPEKVRQALEKARTDGIVATIEAVRARLDEPLPLGYCNVGRVIEVGDGIDGFAVGDRVASNGRHAEVVVVAKHLAARIPDEVEDAAAAFTVPGAIALQGMRLAGPTLGEAFVVIGLGLIGLMAVQLLKANGCRVLGIDPDEARLSLAGDFGADTATTDGAIAAADTFSRGRGVDGVLIAAATDSDRPVADAARMCRKRGRIVLIGTAGLALERSAFYEKELGFQVSCSYGPGRHDPAYEEGGHDYPLGFVRWTEQRNFEAVLDMMAARRIDPRPLITHRFPVARAAEAFELLASRAPSLGIVLDYPAPPAAPARVVEFAQPSEPGKAVLGAIGAGAHAMRMLFPGFRSAGASLRAVASANGVSAAHAARRFGFASAAGDADAVLGDADIDAVCIATRHDSHARLVASALAAGKHVFVEKPLCLSLDELAAIEDAHAASGRILVVGFNRRFAPLVQRMKSLLDPLAEACSIVITVNAGALPEGHWTLGAGQGGRIVGEACHFIDLARHLAGSAVSGFEVAGLEATHNDTATITLRFGNGSVAVVNYFANGHRGYPKERVEVFCGGRVLVLDNHRRLTGHGWPGFRRALSWRQDKGHRACVHAFVEAVRQGRPSPVPTAEAFEASRIAIEAAAGL